MLFALIMLAAAMQTPLPVPHVDAVEIVVRDITAERSFYTRALGFADLGSRAIPGARIDRLALGKERIELVKYDRAGAPIPSGTRSNDRTFQHIAIIVSDMQRAWQRVEGVGIHKVSAAPQVLPKWNPNAGGIAAVYFRDPEGHPLELLRFPAGKGAAQWHARSPLFLGIDHSAIAVADPAASARFYESLGFAIRGHSNNYGIEQERLSGVRAAHVQITALRFDRAPGVEFLHYVRPARSQPRENARPFDLVATRTVLIEPSAAAMCKRFAAMRGNADGCLLRDPDGHFVEIRSSGWSF